MLDCTLRDGGYYNNWDFNPNIVKAIIDQETNIVECHNFTRSKPNSEFLYEHIGIYAYRKSALEKFVNETQKEPNVKQLEAETC